MSGLLEAAAGAAAVVGLLKVGAGAAAVAGLLEAGAGGGLAAAALVMVVEVVWAAVVMVEVVWAVVVVVEVVRAAMADGERVFSLPRGPVGVWSGLGSDLGSGSEAGRLRVSISPSLLEATIFPEPSPPASPDPTPSASATPFHPTLALSPPAAPFASVASAVPSAPSSAFSSFNKLPTPTAAARVALASPFGLRVLIRRDAARASPARETHQLKALALHSGSKQS